MGIVLKIIVTLIASICSCLSYSQVVNTIVVKDQGLEYIGNQIVEFWKESDNSSRDSDNFIVRSLNDLCIGKYVVDKTYIPFHLLSNNYLSVMLEEKQGIYLLGFTNLDPYHLLVIDENALSLINMNNSLSNIIIQVTNSFSYSDELVGKIIKEVVQTHRNNWYLNHASQVERFLESYEGVFIEEIDNYPTENDFNNLYNPNEW